jgi:hypothetical protein
METNTLERTGNRMDTNNPKELVNIYNEFIKKLQEKVKNTKYNGEAVYTLTEKPSELSALQLNESGIRNIKRFKRYLKHAMYGGSVNSINKLLHLVHKRILKLDKYPRLVSVKHDKIQKLKSEWKKQQLIADQMLAEYKKEKGDFYKSTFKF